MGRPARALILAGALLGPGEASPREDPRLERHAALAAAVDAGHVTRSELEELCRLSLALASDAGGGRRGSAGAPDVDALVDTALAACARIESHEARARLTAGIADLQRGRGRFVEAAELLQDAVDALDRSRFVRPLLLQMLAEVRRRTESWVAALELLDAAEAALLDGDPEAPEAVVEFHREVRSLVAGCRAQVWTELGVWEMAARALALEERLARSTASLGDDVVHLTRRADNLFARMRFEDARRLLRDALAREEIAAAPPARDLLRGYLGVALAELERIDPDGPREAARQFDAAVASPFVTDVSRAVFLLARADAALREGALDDAARSLERADAILGRTSATVHETALLEAHRARLLRRRGAPSAERAAQHDRLARAFDVFLARWTAAPTREGSIGFLHLGTRRLILSELIRSTLALVPGPAGVERAVGHFLAAQTRGTHARARRLPTPTLDAVRRVLLDDGGGILAFLTSRERSLLFAIDRNDAEVFDLAGGVALRKVCRPLGEALLRTTDPGRIAPLARAAAERLLPRAVEDRLRAWTSVTVVGGDLLFDVPLECLPLSDGGRLGEAVAVAHLPSLPLGLLLAERPGPPADALDLLLVAAPKPRHRPPPPHPALPSLPFDRTAAERLTRWFDAARVRVLAGADADAERLRAAPLPAAAVTHFVAHGTHDLGRERGAGLVLHGDGSASDVLFCEDVERHLATPGLVVLSACGSALGPSRMGDDRLAHLGGAFLNAGARAVVLSRAEIEYHATLALMETLHARLAAGDSPAAALTAARRRAAADGDAYYGARFQVVGLATRPILSARRTAAPPAAPPRTTLVVVGAGALLAAGLLTLAFFGRRLRVRGA